MSDYRSQEALIRLASGNQVRRGRSFSMYRGVPRHNLSDSSKQNKRFLNCRRFFSSMLTIGSPGYCLNGKTEEKRVFADWPSKLARIGALNR